MNDLLRLIQSLEYAANSKNDRKMSTVLKSIFFFSETQQPHFSNISR